MHSQKLFSAASYRFAVLILPILLIVQGCRLPLEVEQRGGDTVLNFTTLGEYPTSVYRIVLSDLETKEVIWELIAEDSVPQIWEVTLRAGRNPANLDSALNGEYRVLIPTDSDVFFLEPSAELKIKAWSDSTSRPSAATFSLPPAEEN